MPADGAHNAFASHLLHSRSPPQGSPTAAAHLFEVGSHFSHVPQRTGEQVPVDPIQTWHDSHCFEGSATQVPLLGSQSWHLLQSFAVSVGRSQLPLSGLHFKHRFAQSTFTGSGSQPPVSGLHYTGKKQTVKESNDSDQICILHDCICHSSSLWLIADHTARSEDYKACTCLNSLSLRDSVHTGLMMGCTTNRRSIKLHKETFELTTLTLLHLSQLCEKAVGISQRPVVGLHCVHLLAHDFAGSGSHAPFVGLH